MTIEPTNEPDLNDDLDAFSDMFHGKTPVTEEVQTDPDTVAETEDQKVEDTEDKDTDPDSRESAESEAPVEKPKKINKVQERINQVLERERLARERAEAAERKIEELTRTKETVPNTPTQNVKGEPQPDDKDAEGNDKYPLGEFDPSYIRDLTRHLAQAEQASIREQQRIEQEQQQEQAARAALNNEWKAKLDTVTDQHEDFFDKTITLEETFDNLDPSYSDYLVTTIKALDHGPEVLYYFANHLDEAQRFVQMGPHAATLALGEINAMFKGQTRKEVKVSSAPVPPQLNKGTSTRKTVAADTDDLDAFESVFFKK